MPRFIPTLPSDRRHIPLLTVLVLALITVVSVFYVVNVVVKVDGESMLPALQDGDRILVTRNRDLLQRGDIVSFSVVIDGKKDRLLKRVVALGGDTVEVNGDTILVNGVPEAGTYDFIVGGENFHIGPISIPARSVYVLGDNRPVSLDSRFFGPVELDNVRGKAVYVISPITNFKRIDATGERP